MPNSIELSFNQAFEQERMTRLIQDTTSVSDLRKMALLFMQGWMTQRAATTWALSQSLSAPSRIDVAAFSAANEAVQTQTQHATENDHG